MQKYVLTLCRSRQELSREYFFEKFGFDTAENGPLKVCQKLENKLLSRTNIGLTAFFGLRPVRGRCAAVEGSAYHPPRVDNSVMLQIETRSRWLAST